MKANLIAVVGRKQPKLSVADTAYKEMLEKQTQRYREQSKGSQRGRDRVGARVIDCMVMRETKFLVVSTL